MSKAPVRFKSVYIKELIKKNNNEFTKMLDLSKPECTATEANRSLWENMGYDIRVGDKFIYCEPIRYKKKE